MNLVLILLCENFVMYVNNKMIIMTLTHLYDYGTN